MIMNNEESRNVLNGLRRLQFHDYATFEEYFHALKRRLRIYTGKDEVMFYDESKTVYALHELGMLYDSEIKAGVN